MANIKGLINDPEFKALPMSEQRALLSEADAGFKGLSDDDFKTFISEASIKPREMFRGGVGENLSPEEAKDLAQRRLVAREKASGNDRLDLVNEGTPEQNVAVKGQGVIPRALAATVGGGFTSGPARVVQDALLKTGLTSKEAVDALGVERVAEENPGTTLAGNLAGGLVPAGTVFQGATTGARILKAGGLGAAFGASESIKEGGIDRITDDPGQIVKDSAVSAAFSTILPVVLESPALAKSLGQSLLSGKITPETQQLIREAEKMDIPITPAQATGSRRLGLTEKTLENIPTSSGVMQTRREAVQEGLANKAKNLIEDASPKKMSEQQFGQEVQARLVAREGKFKSVASRLYDKFEKSVPEGAEIQLGRARDLAQDFIEREKNKEGFGSSKLMSQLQTFVGEADDMGKAVPKSTDVRTFLDIRAAVNDEINSAIKNERGDIARKLGMIKSEMDKSLGDFAKLQGGDVDKSFRFANDFYAKGAKVFNDPKIQRMIQKDPGLVYDMIAQPGTVQEINTLKKALGESKFAPVRRALMEKVLANDGADVFSPAKFGTSLSKFTPENLEAVFGPQKVKEIQSFWKIADAVVKNEKRVGNPSGTAQNVISPGYWAGVVSLTFHNPIAGGAAVIGPNALAKLYTSKAGMRLLTDAAKTPVGSPRASELSSRLTAILSNDDDEPIDPNKLEGRIDLKQLEKELTIERKMKQLEGQTE